MNQAATEIMLALGLHDRMVGTAFLDDSILPEFAEAYKTIDDCGSHHGLSVP
jgi:iron complex transport system substrate-binding protein